MKPKFIHEREKPEIFRTGSKKNMFRISGETGLGCADFKKFAKSNDKMFEGRQDMFEYMRILSMRSP